MNFRTKVFFHCGKLLRGWNVLECLDELRNMESWPRERVESFQLERLRLITRHACRNVPFYRDLWAKAGVSPEDLRTLDDLAAFPKTNKEVLRQAGDRTLDGTASKSAFVRARTSGSTGSPFVYYKSADAHSWFIASAFLNWTWSGWRPGAPWARMQSRPPLGLSERIQDWVFKCLYMPIDNLREDYLKHLVEKAIRHRPVMIRSYSGAAYALARHLLKTGDERLRPRSVVTLGQTLYPRHREAIEEAFGCLVFDTYGAEGMSVAFQCREGAYHISPAVHVEFEPEGPRTPEGQPCRMLLTSLWNTAMPMIRYDVGDLAIVGNGGCGCGRTWPVLKQVMGRMSDIVVTPAGDQLTFPYFADVLGGEVDGVDRFMVLQNVPDRVTLKLVVNDRFDRKAHGERIKQMISAAGGDGFGVDIEYVDALPLSPTGKQRLVVSTV